MAKVQVNNLNIRFDDNDFMYLHELIEAWDGKIIQTYKNVDNKTKAVPDVIMIQWESLKSVIEEFMKTCAIE